jgi:hypothetical protein
MMSFSTPHPVISGHVYRVVSVNGSVPVNLEQFIGEASFSVLNHGAGSSRIRGQGSTQGDSVRFQEKDVDSSGKDVRVWQVTEIDGDFTATAISAF